MKSKNNHAAFLPDGEIDKQRIGRTANRAMASLVAGIRRTAPNPAPAIMWLQQTITAVYNMGRTTDFVDTLKLLYALTGLTTPPDLEPLVSHPVTASRFMLSCLCALEELTEGASPIAVD